MFARSFCGRARLAVRCASKTTGMPLRAKVTNPAFGGRAQVRMLRMEVGDWD
jgi:hypothetical protein